MMKQSRIGTTYNRQPAMRMAYELQKLLRGKPLSRMEIKEELGWSRMTVDKWVREGEELGVFVAILGDKKPASGGRRPVVYTLSKHFGGQA